MKRNVPEPASPFRPLPIGRAPVLKPAAPGGYEVRFTATPATCEKLERAKELLRHAVPGGDMAEIVDRAVTVLLEELARARLGASAPP